MKINAFLIVILFTYTLNNCMENAELGKDGKSIVTVPILYDKTVATMSKSFISSTTMLFDFKNSKDLLASVYNNRVINNSFILHKNMSQANQFAYINQLIQQGQHSAR